MSMSKKIVFVILWSTFLVALTGCAGGRRAKVISPVGGVPGAELSKGDQEIKLRAKELELQDQLKRVEEEKKKFYTPYEKKARREIKRREKNERSAEQREARAENTADIFCPDARAKEEVVIHNTGHFIYNRWQAFSRLAISNPYGFTVRISAIDPNRNKSGSVVDLPGGCTVTLSRSIVPLVETSNWGTLSYYYVAQALNPGDQKGIARSDSFSLFPGNGMQQMHVSLWVIGNFKFW